MDILLSSHPAFTSLLGPMPSELTLDGGRLSVADVEAVARRSAPVRISEGAARAVADSRRLLETILKDGQPHYGINTGFGSLSRRRIDTTLLSELQKNLVRSHSVGVGPPLGDDVVRATMLLLAASLARARSGVRPVVVEGILAMLNAGITPIVPETGSVGASGDLAPLAHIALSLIGEGTVRVRGEVVPADSAMDAVGILPVSLEAKEGLALINGTHLMAARGALLVRGAARLFEAAMVASAMSIDACRATDSFLDERVYVARQQPGPAAVAACLRRLLHGSEILPSHRLNDPRVQDPYSLRCVAPVLGAALDAFEYASARLADELGAVTDNPLVFGGLLPGGATGVMPEIISAGNFHGMPVAIPLDVMSLVLSHVAGVSERRTYHMLSGFDAETRLPSFLSPEPGLHSGLMIVQYTAAACCNEIVGLSNPASSSNISTSAGMEDYNSFGPRAAAKACRALDLARSVIAIELLCASEALEYHRPLRSGVEVERVHAVVRSLVPRIVADRPFAADIAELETAIERGRFSLTR